MFVLLPGLSLASFLQYSEGLGIAEGLRDTFEKSALMD